MTSPSERGVLNAGGQSTTWYPLQPRKVRRLPFGSINEHIGAQLAATSRSGIAGARVDGQPSAGRVLCRYLLAGIVRRAESRCATSGFLPDSHPPERRSGCEMTSK